jgi:hypothetical protein
MPLRAALADGSVALHGAPNLVRGFAQVRLERAGCGRATRRQRALTPAPPMLSLH